MLIRLTPDQISAGWDSISEGIFRVVPILADGTGEAGLNNILRQLMAEEMQVWFIFNDKEDKKVRGVLTTKVMEELGTRERYLRIYTLSGSKVFKDGLFEELHKSLISFAKEQGCGRLVAFSNKADIVKAVAQLGYNVDTRVLSKEISYG